MKITIKQRLLMLVGVLMLALVVEAGFGVAQLRNLADIVGAMEGQTFPRVSLLQEIHLSMTTMELNVKRLILTDERVGFDEEEAKHTLLKQHLASQLTALDSQLQTPQDKQAFRELNRYLAEYFKVENDVLKLASKAVDAMEAKHFLLGYELNQKAFRLQKLKAMPHLTDGVAELTAIQKQAERELNQNVVDTTAAYHNGLRLSWFALALLAVMGAGGSWLILRAIDQRTQQLAGYAERLARGLIDEVPGAGEDEFSVVENANQVVGQSLKLMMRRVNEVVTTVQKGQLNARLTTEQFEGEWLLLAVALNDTLNLVEYATLEIRQQAWVNTGLSDLASKMMGKNTLAELAAEGINHLARYTDAQMGAFYVFGADGQSLHLIGRFAYELRDGLSSQFALGEGLVGQAALDKKFISVNQLPDDYARIQSGLGDTLPRSTLVAPLLYQGEVRGVIELCRVAEFDHRAIDFLLAAADRVAVAIMTAESNDRALDLLQQTQAQAQQLQQQQEELQQTNEELEEQAQALRANEQQLKLQQEELQQTNEELEEQTQLLRQQREEVLLKNNALLQAQQNLQQQADDLAIASKYKSEFLANMSHELRTPLNSMLILSRSLANNQSGNLTEKQVQAARVVHQSGADLLKIINDILDLSKIEAGREVAVMEEVDLKELANSLHELYLPEAENKRLTFTVQMDEALPATIISDRQRLGQILRNLLSNAFKFTRQGGVRLKLATVAPGAFVNGKPMPKDCIALSVIDTGIGIPLEKQKHIWESFQQADGSTSREYGGTGLGLTISRELVRLLGGEIQLVTEPGNGAAFTLYLPMVGRRDAPANQTFAARGERDAAQENEAGEPLSSELVTVPQRAADASSLKRIADDRATLKAGESVILIVEDDLAFAQILADLCHENKMKYLATPSAEEALELIGTHPILGVMLDMQLHERDGWSVLTRLKDDLDTLHIPVYVISVEERNRRVLQCGAVGFLQKPATVEQLQCACDTVTKTVDKKIKEVLLVEDDTTLRTVVHELLDADDVSIYEAPDGGTALAIMARQSIDLIVMDLGLPDMSGFELLKRITTRGGDAYPPVIIYTGRELTREEYDRLQLYSNNIIVKGVRSNERLVEEAAMFLHRRVASLPERTRKMLASLRDRDGLFAGKTVLLVDDDIRNLFALSGLLEERGMTVLTAKNGADALTTLSAHPTVDMLLTDIMMPVMDGYELIEKVRSQSAFANLPVLALTAKAMKEDRDRCLEVGASDYLSKPVDVDRLLSVMRVWLYR